MTTTNAPTANPLTYTTAWTRLTTLTWDQLALLMHQVENGLELGRSDALWLGRCDKLWAEFDRRGVTAHKSTDTWMVGYPSMFEPCA